MQVRIWDHASGSCLVTLNGHKTGVSALRYNASGSLLASGSRDTDIVIWDVVGEAGLFRLRGHRDQVTALAFLGPLEAVEMGAGGKAGTAGTYVASSSKDGLIKVRGAGGRGFVRRPLSVRLIDLIVAVTLHDSNPTSRV